MYSRDPYLDAYRFGPSIKSANWGLLAERSPLSVIEPPHGLEPFFLVKFTCSLSPQVLWFPLTDPKSCKLVSVVTLNNLIVVSENCLSYMSVQAAAPHRKEKQVMIMSGSSRVLTPRSSNSPIMTYIFYILLSAGQLQLCHFHFMLLLLKNNSPPTPPAPADHL